MLNKEDRDLAAGFGDGGLGPVVSDAKDCELCDGTGLDPDLPQFQCPACRGTGKEPQ